VISESPLKENFKSDTAAAEPDPFSPEELEKLDIAAEGPVRLVYLLFRWTGLRGSDVAALTWGAIDLDEAVLRWMTKKRKTIVSVPLNPELTAELKKYRGAGRILPGSSRGKLYEIIKALGEKTGVENCRPHRFRHTFACTILQKGGSVYDVAKILGDKVATVEKYYGRFTDEARERVRNVLSQEKTK
jgi:integrase